MPSSCSPTGSASAPGSSRSPARARETTFRSPVLVADRETLVTCDQLATVDLRRLTEPAGLLTVEEMQRVDDALALVLDL
jgi:mRNA interferase MazF